MIAELSQIERASRPQIDAAGKLPFKRYFFKEFDHRTGLCLVLKGPRGIGKTTSIFQYLNIREQAGEKCFYLPADIVTIRDLSLIDIAEHLHASGTKILAIDEIQKRKNFADELKTIRDLYPNLELIASGSSAIELEGADLSRRAFKYECSGLSFREFLSLTYKIDLPSYQLSDIVNSHSKIAPAIVAEMTSRKIDILEDFQRYLRQGYFPNAIVMNNSDIFFKTIRQAIDRTIESDLLSIYPNLNGSSIGKMKKLISILSKTAPFTPDYITLKTALDLSNEKTIKDYFFYLHKADVIRLLSKNKENISNMRKPEKIYFDNPNYLCAVAAEGTVNIGTLRETFVFMSIENHLSMHADNNTSKVFSSKTGDFETMSGLTFEVGGKSKGFKQIAQVQNSFIIADDILFGEGRKIPIWILGFLW